MSTSLTKFEARVPIDSGNGTPADLAIETFLNNLGELTPYSFSDMYQKNTDGSISQFLLVSGLLTAGQASTALGYLNTLNTALGSNILCYSSTVTQQP